MSSTAPSISKSEDKKYVYYFGDGSAEGNAKMKEILGGKGAGLAEMTNIGVPVPPGFTISTEVCTYFYEHGKQYPPELRDVDSARFDASVLPAVPDVALAYRNDAQTVAAQVEKGAADAAVLLRPVGVDTIRAAAAADLRMPEKTTFFAPKPRTGMVFRSLDS